MPYSVGSKGSYGCSGYPAVKDDGTVMGCHKTRGAAARQIYAINVSEGNIDKAMVKEGDMVMAPHEEEVYVGRVVHVMTEGMLGFPGSEYSIPCPTCKELNVNCENCPVCREDETMKDCCGEDVSKKAPCWEGYVQRGMKPGKNGRMVPNCVPVEKIWSGSAFDLRKFTK